MSHLPISIFFFLYAVASGAVIIRALRKEKRDSWRTLDTVMIGLILVLIAGSVLAGQYNYILWLKEGVRP